MPTGLLIQVGNGTKPRQQTDMIYNPLDFTDASTLSVNPELIDMEGPWPLQDGSVDKDISNNTIVADVKGRPAFPSTLLRVSAAFP